MSKALLRAIEQATSIEDVDRTKRIITHKINTDCLDRYQTVIFPRGMRCENFNANPTVFWNHDASKPPIGKNLSLKTYDRKIVARTLFTPRGMNPDADTIFEMYADGFLNAWSVSIDPIAFGAPTPDEIRKRPEWAGARCMYREWDLFEYSCVTIPGNQEVCRKAIERGYNLAGWTVDPTPDPVFRKTETPGLPPLTGRSLDQVTDAVVRQMLAGTSDQRSRVFRDALDLAKGKV